MPTPIGHALGGLIVGLATAKRGTRSSRTFPRYVTACAVAACLPDLDFLWGRHNMETHSLGFAVLVGCAAFGLATVTGVAKDRPAGSARLAVACTLAVASHVLFDWLGSDDFPPLGVMALWPVSSEFYFADAFVFEAISRRYWLPNFLTHNLLAVAREVVLLAPVAAALFWWRRRVKTPNRIV